MSQAEMEEIEPTEEEIVYVIKKSLNLKGYLVTAHQFGPNRSIVNEQAMIFLGDEWQPVQAEIINYYMQQGDWFVNISQLTKVGLRTLLRKMEGD